MIHGVETGVSVTQLQPDTSERFVSLRRDLGVSTFGLNQMVLRPGQRSRIHRHAHQEEVYLILEGTLTLSIEQQQRELGPGSLARVAPDVRRQLINRGPERLLMIALGGAVEHNGRDGEAFPSWEATEGRPPQEIPLPDDLA
jgi:mannose-6-phosphate isomerase-like protein (cupin superfamily)